MVNLALNRVNVVKPRLGGGPRRARLTRWKPPVRRGRRRRGRSRRQKRPVGPLVEPSRSRQGILWEATLVGLKNNFWGLLHRGGRLVWSISAGAVPGYPGSKRGRLQAAGAVAAGVRSHLRRGPPRRARRGPRRWRGRRPEGIWPRRPRRWTRRGRWTRRTRVTTLGVNLVGWNRDKRWRYAVGQLRPRGRVWLRVRPRRVHNGLRGRKQRRC